MQGVDQPIRVSYPYQEIIKDFILTKLIAIFLFGNQIITLNLVIRHKETNSYKNSIKRDPKIILLLRTDTND